MTTTTTKFITFDHIVKHLGQVRSEEIGRCHAVIAPNGATYYLVENEDGNVNAEGHVVEYRVTNSRKYGIRCTCESGKHGFWNVHHASGVCKHVRWAVACRLEETAALAEQERLNSLKQAVGIGYTDVDAQTLKRIAQRNGKQKPTTAYAPINGNRAFSLLK